MYKHSEQRQHSLQGIIAMLITVIFWASAFVGIRAVLDYYSPIHLALLRYLIASFVLILYGTFTGIRLPAKKDGFKLLVLGAIGIAFYNFALNYGEQTISAGAASFLVNTVPIFTAVLAFFFLRERITGYGWLGIAAGFFGVSIIAFEEAIEVGVLFDWGAVYVLLAALAQALYFVFQKSLLRRYRPFELTTYAIWMGTLCMLPFQKGLYEAILDAPLPATLAVLYLGVFPGALGYVAYAVALSNMQAVKASNYLFLVPVVTLFIAWIWLSEVPGLLTLAGGALALFGVVLMLKKGDS